MHAGMIDLLSAKGKFPPEQAVVLAEAIDMAIEKAQLVTVPILDARLAAVNTRSDSLEAKVTAKIDASEAQLTAKIHASEAQLTAKIHASEAKLTAKIHASEAMLTAKIDASEAMLTGKINALEAKLDAKMERWAVKMVIVMVAVQTALGPIGMQVLNTVRQALATLIR